MSLTPASLEHLVARLVCIGFDGLEVPRETQDLLASGVGGLVLFGRNIETPAQVAELTTKLKRMARAPLMMCVDQEGGRVRRLRTGFSPVPSMRELGKTRSPELARSIGALIGRELRAVGFDVDFAPVLDVDSNPLNPVIADRSLGNDPQMVAQLGVEVIRGLQSQGVAACGKHFPGHGDTSLDSHHRLPVLDHGWDRLSDVELVPFAAAVNAGSAAMMTSHIVFPRFDPIHPATLSPLVLDHFLRDRLGFDGVVFTDDMEMKAIADHFGFDDSIVRAIDAGADVITICHSAELQRRAIDVLARAVATRRLSIERIQQSVRRIDTLCSRYVRGPQPTNLGPLDSPEHRAILGKVAKAATQPQLDPTTAWQP
ncbi:MAG: beta-N-acetylhexosaminidase [Tepidisphaeraceae bacterium]